MSNERNVKGTIVLVAVAIVGISILLAIGFGNPLKSLKSGDQLSQFQAKLSPDGKALADLYQSALVTKKETARLQALRQSYEQKLEQEKKILVKIGEAEKTLNEKGEIILAGVNYTKDQVAQDKTNRLEHCQFLGKDITDANNGINVFSETLQNVSRLISRIEADLEKRGQSEEIEKAALVAVCLASKVGEGGGAVFKVQPNQIMGRARQEFTAMLENPLTEVMAAEKPNWKLSQSLISDESWLPELKKDESVTLNLQSRQQPVSSTQPATEPGVLLTPAVSNAEVMVTIQWTPTGIVAKPGDLIEWGPFKNQVDLARLEQRVGPSIDIGKPGVNGDEGKWLGLSTVWSNDTGDQLFVRVNKGDSLFVPLLLKKGAYHGPNRGIKRTATPAPKSKVKEDVVSATTADWTESEVVAYDRELVQFGPFADRKDVERLRIRSGGADHGGPLTPIELWDGKWCAKVTFTGLNAQNAPLRVKLVDGEPLSVNIRKVNAY